MASILPNDDFDADVAAQQFAKAFKGRGTDEDEVIRLMTSHNNQQRQEIARTYKRTLGEDLTVRLKKELKGDLEAVCLALMTPPALYDAQQLMKAMKGTGTDDSVLVEIMCGRNSEQIKAIKDAYKKEFGRDLEGDLEKETRQQFRRLMVAQCNSQRDEADVDEDMAEEEANIIKDGGEEQWGTNEAAIQKILCRRSYRQLNATFKVYMRITGRDIEDTITAETKGSVQKGFLAIVKFAKSPARFYAEKIHTSMKGMGTKEEDLIRLIVSRTETDMRRICYQYHNMYGVTLVRSIEKDTKKDFRKILMILVGSQEDDGE